MKKDEATHVVFYKEKYMYLKRDGGEWFADWDDKWVSISDIRGLTINQITMTRYLNIFDDIAKVVLINKDSRTPLFIRKIIDIF